MKYENILRHWFAGEKSTVTEIKKGISSNACHVNAGNKEYILRRVAGQEQAEREALICSLLSDAGVSPRLINTMDGQSCILDGEYWFNLQEYYHGKVPDMKDRIAICAVAEAVGITHKTLRDASVRVTGTDRFNTVEMLEKAKEESCSFSVFFPETVSCFAEMVQYAKKAEAVLQTELAIHGDLGAWNLLWDGERMLLIDFGESRMGDPCFDLAAVLGSMAVEADECKLKRNVEHFLDRYERIFRSVSWERLRTACWLWQFRGALASAVYLPEGVQRKKQIQLFYQNFIRLKRVL